MEIFVDKIKNINNPFNQALFFMGGIPYIQPFVDGNKRTGRIMANQPLLQSGFAPFSYKDMDKTDYSQAITLIYEKKDFTYLKEIFKDSYLKSAPEISQRLSEPMRELDSFDLKYRKEIKEVIKNIVQSLGKKNIKKSIDDLNLELGFAELGKLTSIINNNLLNLHVGQLIIYGISDQEFENYNYRNNLT